MALWCRRSLLSVLHRRNGCERGLRIDLSAITRRQPDARAGGWESTRSLRYRRGGGDEFRGTWTALTRIGGHHDYRTILYHSRTVGAVGDPQQPIEPASALASLYRDLTDASLRQYPKSLDRSKLPVSGSRSEEHTS